MDIDTVIKPLDRDTIAEGKTRTFLVYDLDMYVKIRRIAGREGTTTSGMIHRMMKELVEEYYERI